MFARVGDQKKEQMRVEKREREKVEQLMHVHFCIYNLIGCR